MGIESFSVDYPVAKGILPTAQGKSRRYHQMLLVYGNTPTRHGKTAQQYMVMGHWLREVDGGLVTVEIPSHTRTNWLTYPISWSR